MKASTRRAVAYIAGRAVSGNSKTTIYDYSSSGYHFFSGQAGASRVSVFDYTQSCHITGTLPNLFHYGDGHHLSLKIQGQKFTGFDYLQSQHFSGSVSGNRITLFDYGDSSYYNYTL